MSKKAEAATEFSVRAILFGILIVLLLLSVAYSKGSDAEIQHPRPATPEEEEGWQRSRDAEELQRILREKQRQSQSPR